MTFIKSIKVYFLFLFWAYYSWVDYILWGLLMILTLKGSLMRVNIRHSLIFSLNHNVLVAIGCMLGVLSLGFSLLLCMFASMLVWHILGWNCAFRIYILSTHTCHSYHFILGCILVIQCFRFCHECMLYASTSLPLHLHA